jgi:excisionase family DNA binding protein
MEKSEVFPVRKYSSGKSSIQPNAVYSRKEAADALGVSLSTLKKLIDQGYLQVSQPPGMRRVFIKGSSILMMLDQTVVNASTQRMG